MKHDEEQLGRLYHRLEKAAPSPMVDARIRRSAHKSARRERQRLMTRWLSFAAVLVLSVGVVLRVVEETPVKQDFEAQVMSRESVPMEIAPIESALKKPSGAASLPEQSPAVLPKQASQDLNGPDAGGFLLNDRQKNRQQAVMAGQASADLTDDKTPAIQNEPVMLQKKVAPLAASPAASAVNPPESLQDSVSQSSPGNMAEGRHDDVARELAESDGVDDAGFAAAKVSWCGQSDLAGVMDRQRWQERMELLRNQQQTAQADCIEQLLNSRLAY